MFGSVITRALIMSLGYVYPAYECFKTAERSRPDVEQLRFWCQYWMIIAVMTVAERIVDVFVSWLPMYNEAKLAFILYLWHPKTKGATYIYNAFFQPVVSKHEPEIDRLLKEYRTRSSDMALYYWQLGCKYAQERVLEVLRYAAAHAPQAQQQLQPQQGMYPPPPQYPQQYQYPQYAQQPRVHIQEEEEDESFDDYDVVEEPVSPIPSMDAQDPASSAYMSRLRPRSSRPK
eukprot:jgi/Mesen1/8859/ME000053S08257